MSQRGKVFVIAGPSGAGKGTLVEEVIERFPELKLSISDTTRKTRPGDIPSKSYNFLTEAEFKKKIKKGEFLEWAVVHGHWYGTPFSFVRDFLQAGRSVVLEIDVQGALQVKEKMPEAVLIFITVPSLEILKKRLVRRKTESERELAIRLENAKLEMEKIGEFDHVVVNDKLEQAVSDLSRIIRRELSA